MNDITSRVREKYDEKADRYDRYLAPMEKMAMGRWRQLLCAKAQGLTLEAGCGTGANFSYYPPGAHVIAVDFSPRMLDIARNKAPDTQAHIELRLEDIQKLSFVDNMFDTVITSCVFCSVPDAISGFQELRRVLKPDGNLYFLEHVRSEGVVLGRLMDLFNSLSVKWGGVNINRRTEDNIERAGLEISKVMNLFGDIVKLIEAKPNKPF